MGCKATFETISLVLLPPPACETSLQPSSVTKKKPKNKRKADSAYTFIWDPNINNVQDEGANVFHFQCLSILWTGKNKDGKNNNNASLVLSGRRAKRRLLHISCDRHQNKVDASLDGKPLPLATPRQQGEGGR